MMTKAQAQALASLVHEIRPEWDAAGVFACLKPLAQNHLETSVLAAIRCAFDKTAKTPGAIPNMNGPHWRDKPVVVENKGVVYPPKKHEECPRHPGQWPENCSGCRADRLTGDVTPPRVATDRVDHHAHADSCRTQLHGGNQ